MVEKIISGFQDGADIAGIDFARKHNIATGGHIPFGYRTLSGNKLEYAEFGAIEHPSYEYPPRTEENVKNSDVTVRFAGDLFSAGEKCTLKFIKRHKKEHFDVDFSCLSRINIQEVLKAFDDFLLKNNVKILNVAGNSPKTYPKIYKCTMRFLDLWWEQYANH